MRNFQKIFQRRRLGEHQRTQKNGPKKVKNAADWEILTESVRRDARAWGKKPFERLVRELFHEIDGTLRIQKEEIEILEKVVDGYMVGFLGDCNLCAEHRHCSMVQEKDLLLVRRIRGHAPFAPDVRPNESTTTYTPYLQKKKSKERDSAKAARGAAGGAAGGAARGAAGGAA